MNKVLSTYRVLTGSQKSDQRQEEQKLSHAAKDGSGSWIEELDRRSAVVLLRSRVVFLVSRQISGLSQHVNDCRRNNDGDDDKSGDGSGIVRHASTSAL